MTNYLYLDSKTRDYMNREVTRDIENNKIFYSKFLKFGVESKWNYLLSKMVTSHDSAWLDKEIKLQNLYVDNYYGIDLQISGGNFDLSDKEPSKLAVGEFNRYYLRALCFRAIVENKELYLYNSNKLLDSDNLEQKVSPEILMQHLRFFAGLNTEVCTIVDQLNSLFIVKLI